MKLFQQAVTDENDIYVYFEVIRQLQPSSVLDFGMMLKRMGALSRQAMNCRIPQNIRLDGVDLYPYIELPIYQIVYDNIYDMKNLPDRKYDLGVMLCMSESSAFSVIDDFCKHTSMILFDADEEFFLNYFIQRYPCQEMKLEERTFALAYCNR